MMIKKLDYSRRRYSLKQYEGEIMFINLIKLIIIVGCTQVFAESKNLVRKTKNNEYGTKERFKISSCPLDRSSESSLFLMYNGGEATPPTANQEGMVFDNSFHTADVPLEDLFTIPNLPGFFNGSFPWVNYSFRSGIGNHRQKFTFGMKKSISAYGDNNHTLIHECHYGLYYDQVLDAMANTIHSMGYGTTYYTQDVNNMLSKIHDLLSQVKHAIVQSGKNRADYYNSGVQGRITSESVIIKKLSSDYKNCKFIIDGADLYCEREYVE